MLCTRFRRRRTTAGTGWKSHPGKAPKPWTPFHLKLQWQTKPMITSYNFPQHHLRLQDFFQSRSDLPLCRKYAYHSNLLRFIGSSASPFSLRLSQTFGGIPGYASQPGSGKLMRMLRAKPRTTWPFLDFGGTTVFLRKSMGNVIASSEDMSGKLGKGNGWDFSSQTTDGRNILHISRREISTDLVCSCLSLLDNQWEASEHWILHPFTMYELLLDH